MDQKTDDRSGAQTADPDVVGILGDIRDCLREILTQLVMLNQPPVTMGGGDMPVIHVEHPNSLRDIARMAQMWPKPKDGDSNG